MRAPRLSQRSRLAVAASPVQDGKIQAGAARHAVPVEPIDQCVSSAIAIARVLCIFCVMFVHVWPGFGELAVPRFGDRPLESAYRFITDTLGRSSVPLLTVISGYLVSGSFGGRWGQLLTDRARSVLVPLVVWNLIMIAALVTADRLGVDDWDTPDSIAGWANAIVAWGGPSANIPLAFLRDLFVCIGIAPLLIAIVRHNRAGALTLLMLTIVFALLGSSGFPLLRPMILAFFTLGIVLRLNAVDVGQRLVSPPAIAGAVAIVAASLFQLYELVEHPGFRSHAMSGLLLLTRFAMAYLFWVAALVLAGRAAGKRLRRLEPFIFIVFASHPLIIKMLIPLGRLTVGDIHGPGYPAFFLLQPMLCVLIAVSMAWALGRIAPRFLQLLNAGRLPPGELPWQPAPQADPARRTSV